MIKKIISVIVALSIALSCFSFSVSANPISSVKDIGKFASELYDLLDSYSDGGMSKDDFFKYAASTFAKFGVNLSSDMFCFKDFLKVMEFCGFDIPNKFKEWWYENEMGGGGGAGNRDDSILGGYGAICIDTLVSTGEKISTYYGAYGVIHTEWDNTLYIYPDDDMNVLWVYHRSDDKETVYTDRKKCGSLYSDGVHEYLIYGDWRYSDGNSADDATTDLPEKDIPNYDDDSIPDDDLIDFIKNFLLELKLQNPDLSTIEGLLAAILQKCTSIDNKMDEGGGSSELTSEEFKALLDQAILSLVINNNTNNDKLLKELIVIRDILKGFAEGDEIPEDEANSILEGLISGITAGLLSLIGLDVDVGDLVTICKEGGELGIKLLTGIVDIVAFLSAAVPFNVIKTALTTVFGVIFNENAPADLVFTIDGCDYTFLSVSFFNDTNVAGALSLIKGIISVMIIFIFLKWARKFYLNLM